MTSTSRTKLFSILALLISMLLVAAIWVSISTSPPAASKSSPPTPNAFWEWREQVIPADDAATISVNGTPLTTQCYYVAWSQKDGTLHSELICAPINGAFPRADIKDILRQ